MRPGHPTERAVGMEYYVSDVDGVGGHLRERDDQFRVRELERFATEPVDADTGAYPHLVFRATLRGWDTNDFAARLAKALGMSRERVSWAGTKDKHAVTTQLFSVYDVDPDDLPEISGVSIDVLGRAGRSIEFGDLVGNAFELVVREPDRPTNAGAITDELAAFGGAVDEPPGDGAAEDNPDSTLDSSTDEPAIDEPATDEPAIDEPAINDRWIGVPNFFGQQRFGSRRPVTHRVGLEIVREDWNGAVMAYLGNPTDAEPEGTQNARSFVEETRDWQEALDRFPNRLRYERAMCHELAESDGETTSSTFRDALEQLPSNLQRLFVHAAQSFVFNRILSRRLDRDLPFDRPVEGDVVCFADRDAPGPLHVPDPDRLQSVTDRRVRSVTRHCERGRAFVTAPLVGTDTELADGPQGEIERAVLAEFDLAPADFDLPGEFHSTGTRRAILLSTTVSLEFDPLLISFALPKGSYATVVMREYLKADPIDLG